MDVGQIALVLFAVGLGFFAKGITGIGGPMFAIPVLAAFAGVEFAVAVIAIPTLAANVWLLWQNRGASSTVRRFLIPLLITGTVGILIGVWILVSIDDRALSLILALAVIGYIIW
ncbi:MAG: sulfite exporter TauE/SafE family protein, partial [Acidimicrobiia bacterium]